MLDRPTAAAHPVTAKDLTQNGFMEAATKNKRGRPRIYNDMLYSILFDKEKRVAQNMLYAVAVTELMEQHPGDFFFTPKGNLRRQGIAEQIGRMLLQDKYPEEFCKDICEKAMELVKHGYSVKEVEQMIRHGRKTGDW